MTVNHRHARIEAVHHRIADLQRRAVQTAAGSDDAFAEVIGQLQIALEELNVAEEELIEQNEQLAALSQDLAKERGRYQELFDFAPDGYLTTDEAGTVQEANRAAAHLLRVPQKFLAGKPLTVFVAKE